MGFTFLKKTLQKGLIVLMSAALVGTPLLAPLTVAPAHAFLFDSFGVADELELGRKFDVLVRSRMPIVEDPEVKGYIRDLTERLSAKLPPQPFPFTPNVILHNSMNAFAVPGGYLFVHTGLIMHLEHESELAGVMAHEMAHVTQRHVASRIDRSRFTTLASLVGALAGVFIGKNSSSGAGAAVTGSLAAGQAAMLNYSRTDETESDQVGLQYLTTAGFRPQGMVGAFEKIRKLQWTSGLSIPEYLSTHPDVGSRVTEISARVKILPAAIQNRPESDARFSRVQTLIWARYGDPDQAARKFQGSTALDLMGQAMLLARKNRINDAAALFDKALAKAPQDALITREAGIFHYSTGGNRAESLLRKALSLDPRDAMATFFLARFMSDGGNHAEAQAMFKSLLRVYPDDSEIHFYYGRSLGTSGQHFRAYLHLAYSTLYENNLKKTDSWLAKARPLALVPTDKDDLDRLRAIYDDRKQYIKKGF